MSKYYPKTVGFFRWILQYKFPYLKPKEHKTDYADPAHLLWMLSRIDFLDTVGKRARWLAHVNGVLVAKKLISGLISRKTIKKDVEGGYE